MAWKLAFRITAVAAALLIAPFLADDSVQEAVGKWLAGLPLLAFVLLLGAAIIYFGAFFFVWLDDLVEEAGKTR